MSSKTEFNVLVGETISYLGVCTGGDDGVVAVIQIKAEERNIFYDEKSLVSFRKKVVDKDLAIIDKAITDIQTAIKYGIKLVVPLPEGLPVQGNLFNK